jgi:hypothetical protein
MNKTITILLIFFSSISYGQVNLDDFFNTEKIISDDFMESDSTVFRIEINQGKDILSGSERSFLTIFILPQQSYLVYQPGEGSTQQIIADKDILRNAVIEFEKAAKSDKNNGCGKDPEKIHASINLNVNGKHSVFSYCLSNWDGIAELIESVKK